MESTVCPIETPEDPTAPAPGWLAVSRGVALFLGTLAWLNLLGDLRQVGPVATLWWIDGVSVARPMARGALALAAILLTGFAVAPRFPLPLRLLTICGLLAVFALALQRTFQHYQFGALAGPSNRILFPLSLQMAAYIATVLVGLLAGRRGVEHPWRDGFVAAVAVCVCLAGFPLAQMQCVGACPSTETAEAVIVFGFRDDYQSLTDTELNDRVESAVQFLAPETTTKIVLCRQPSSTDPTQNSIQPKTQVFDCNTLAESVETTIQWANDQHLKRLAIVGDNYLLPRTKLRLQQAGFVVQSVPVNHRDQTTRRWRLVVHEVAALWWWYLRPLG